MMEPVKVWLDVSPVNPDLDALLEAEPPPAGLMRLRYGRLVNAERIKALIQRAVKGE